MLFYITGVIIDEDGDIKALQTGRRRCKIFIKELNAHDKKMLSSPEYENGDRTRHLFFSHILVFSRLSAIILRFSESIFMVKDN